MKFKSIEISGFKSFADKLNISFDGGMTAIVGPNGCGKSNVADSIRWVLGEQSSKMLRGSSMQDVIFNGTEKRKSLSYCEVSLIFDNSDHFFNINFDEIVISRKLYRSGESEYYLNRSQCRLKDIVDLLHDSGIGKEGYSIIGQGKVEEIIAAKPENRRAIFEEAAGISKFKFKKLEAERKLERTKENLVRLNDILSEVNRQLGPLKKQREDALKYLDLKSELKDLEINSYIYQYDNASSIKEKINNILNGIKEEIFIKESKINSLDENYDLNMEEISHIDNEVNELHNKVLNLTVGLEKQAGELKLTSERLNFLKQQNSQILDSLEKAKSNLENTKILSDACVSKKEELTDNLEKLEKEEKDITNKYLQIVSELTSGEDDIENSQKEMFEKLNKLGDTKAKLSTLETEKILTEDNLKELELKLKDVSINLSKAENQKQEQEQVITNLKNKIAELKSNNYEITLKINELNDIIKNNNQQKINTYSSLQVTENRLRLLKEMQNEYEGYLSSVKRLLKDSERDLYLKNKIIGVVANLIKVPAKYEVAIEMALGSAVQNIVTKDEDDAKNLINYLKQNSYGRATFLPISSIKPRIFDYSYSKSLSINGCFGIASELIDFDPKINNVISNLLGTTVIVDNIETAVSLAKDTRYGFKIVTLDGDIINPQGSLTGGSKKAEVTNLISRDREIDKLNKDVITYKSKLEEISNILQFSQEKLKENNLNQDKLVKEISQNEIQYAVEQEKLENLQITFENFDKEKMTLTSTKLKLVDKIELIEAKYNEIKGNSSEISSDEMINSNSERFNYLRKQRDELNTKNINIKVQITDLKAQLYNVETEESRLFDLTIDYEEEIKNINNSLEESNKIVSSVERLYNDQEVNNLSSKDQQELNAIKSRQENLVNDKNTLQAKLKEIDEERKNLSIELTKVNDKKYNEEFKLQKVDTELDNMKERILEEYQLDYNSCLQFKKEEFNFEEGNSKINKIKKDIAKLGYVNVNAIEDTKSLEERYGDLSSQIEDLNTSYSELNDIISDLSKEMVTKFKTEFEKINNNFTKTFKELFGGGNAYLQLQDDGNLLESGVEIIAQPPGKKLSSLTLLSGGEKALTAIAILFAILRLKPLPFCLLDEIEAALDDANADRFASYLKRFSNETQFIVITHRKPTMELADNLYGVTMEEKGVSKMVSVKLSDAVKNSV